MGMQMSVKLLSDDKLRALIVNPEMIHEVLDFGQSDPDIDLDKAWHGVHFLLCGDSTLDPEPDRTKPDAFLLRGGEFIGDEDVGYGPARGLMSDEVARVQGVLGSISRDDLAKRFQWKAFQKADIYPGCWDDEDDGEIEYLLLAYDDLKMCVERAARERMGMVIWVS
jgi:hypothetical protein